LTCNSNIASSRRRIEFSWLGEFFLARKENEFWARRNGFNYGGIPGCGEFLRYTDATILVDGDGFKDKSLGIWRRSTGWWIEWQSSQTCGLFIVMHVRVGARA
jgi:hypothetical protein